MKSIEILQKIVASNGNCDTIGHKNCNDCIFSKQKKPDGSPLSCYELVGAHNADPEMADSKYLEVAKKKILDIHMDEMLKDKDES